MALVTFTHSCGECTSVEPTERFPGYEQLRGWKFHVMHFESEHLLRVKAAWISPSGQIEVHSSSKMPMTDAQLHLFLKSIAEHAMEKKNVVFAIPVFELWNQECRRKVKSRANEEIQRMMIAIVELVIGTYAPARETEEEFCKKAAEKLMKLPPALRTKITDYCANSLYYLQKIDKGGFVNDPRASIFAKLGQVGLPERPADFKGLVEKAMRLHKEGMLLRQKNKIEECEQKHFEALHLFRAPGWSEEPDIAKDFFKSISIGLMEIYFLLMENIPHPSFPKIPTPRLQAGVARLKALIDDIGICTSEEIEKQCRKEMEQNEREAERQARSGGKSPDPVSSLVPQRQCASCGVKSGPGGKALMSCAGCKSVQYCSKECQKEHWKKTHKRTCGVDRQARDSAKHAANW
uniref:MYND-type domain-containing protein n=1 Tax=Chromera velia CCMP2878 TaxID=1169474 RepID=A0A0G4HEZ7_9ALVE|eukprot:Cvel_6603.t1-p1 / transcript=Cvel_6603.t1 / gene=Cvel_6603 / organism=Chromera_velia_CCMP2878 / gene_product=hypothetical protein / transcript_product=hypothetical protein / location=Cvel_scaffold326:80384-81598(-) / protein_length=405 / sequence_SO=supercontig / SO=protein_coding / is_pseudo=false